MARLDIETLFQAAGVQVPPELRRRREAQPQVIEGEAVEVKRAEGTRDAQGVLIDDGLDDVEVASEASSLDPEPSDSGEPAGPVLPERSLGVLAQINTAKIATKSQVMEQLNGLLPLNFFNLPEYVYRPDMVDHELMNSSLAALQADPGLDVTGQVLDMLKAAVVEVDYSEGYPRIGLTPIWKTLPWEPPEAYVAFQHYIAMVGVRRLDGIDGYAPEVLAEYFHQYMWAFRIKAYDMYVIANHSRQRIQRSLDVDDHDFRFTDKLIKQIERHIDTKGEEYLTEVPMKDAIAMLEKLTKIRRNAVGLPVGQAPGDMKVPGVVTTQGIMAKIAEHEAVKKETVEDTFFEDILANPDALEKAQDLIVSVNSGQ
jgi:hypothetical protein